MMDILVEGRYMLNCMMPYALERQHSQVLKRAIDEIENQRKYIARLCKEAGGPEDGNEVDCMVAIQVLQKTVGGNDGHS